MATPTSATTNDEVSETVNGADEVASLRSKNAELLGKLKTVKSENERLTADLQSAATARDEALAQVHELRVSAPVRAMVERLSPMPDFMPLALEKHGLRFRLDDESGAIALFDNDGKRVQAPTGKDGTLVDVPFEEGALWQYFAYHCDGTFDQVLRGTGSSGAGAVSSSHHPGTPSAGKGGRNPGSGSPFGIR